ncbi:MAG: hypothetical protein AB7N65_02120 [Vicinamibacterales bacterium]
MSRLVPALCVLLAAACSSRGGHERQVDAIHRLTSPPHPPAARHVAARASNGDTPDWPTCLAIADGMRPDDGHSCPGFVTAALPEMIATCAGVGGRLRPIEEAPLLSLDVNGDGILEFLFDATQSYYCDGAASVFSCGSLGCPVTLVGADGSRWRALGALNARDATATEVLAPAPGQTYRTLRGGCAGTTPCDTWTYYDWTGSSYEASMIEARGHPVDIAPGGLWTLVEETAVLAEPVPSAAPLERYAAGTVVVRIGAARHAPYVYVSPCNACDSGFVAPAALRKFP